MNNNFNWTISQRITHHLMLNSSFINDIGLFNGKMGIAITFYLLGKNEKNQIYTNFGNELLDEISKGLSENMSIYLGSGLSGIGWGIEYLIQNKYVEGDSFKICRQINAKIIESAPKRINDISLENGLWGLLHYVLIHIKGCQLQRNICPFDSDYLQELYIKTKSINTSSKKLSGLIRIFIDYIENNNMLNNYNFDIKDIVCKPRIKESNRIKNQSLGVKSGIAGILLK